MEERMEAVKTLLRSIGEDVNREGLLETPARVAKMYEEIFGGYAVDVSSLLTKNVCRECGHRGG